LVFSLEIGPVFHQFKPSQSPMLATHGPVLPPIAHLVRDGDHGLNSRFYQGPRSIHSRWPIPWHRRSCRQRPSGSATARRWPAPCGRICTEIDAGGTRARGNPLSLAGDASRKEAHLLATRLRVGAALVGSSSARRRGNHRFQSRLCRVGIPASVSPSNEC
jgi:hypothetical protein